VLVAMVVLALREGEMENEGLPRDKQSYTQHINTTLIQLDLLKGSGKSRKAQAKL